MLLLGKTIGFYTQANGIAMFWNGKTICLYRRDVLSFKENTVGGKIENESIIK